LQDDVNVLVRIYATKNPDLPSRITLTTNNQNKITDRDLRANDPIQIQLQRAMREQYGYLYERKNKEFRSVSREEKRRVIPNYKAAQAYLAIVRRKPSQARGYLAKIWSEFYKEIFEQATVEDLITSFAIHDYLTDRAKTLKKDNSTPRDVANVAVYGTFHLARIVGFFLTSDQWGDGNRDQIIQHIEAMEENRSEYLGQLFEQSFEILYDIWRDEAGQEEGPLNPALFFKAGQVVNRIEERISTLQ